VAHQAINAYNQKNKITNSPWLFYKLVNIQYRPIQKTTPGQDYTGPDSSTYYMANIVVESDYNLQVFSGRIAPGGKTISDFLGPQNTTNPTGSAYNSYNNGKFLMGGCMGCHGNATNNGGDYSFIFGFPVQEPEFAGVPANPQTSPRLKRILDLLK
jgi:hypothetical protein